MGFVPNTLFIAVFYIEDAGIHLREQCARVVKHWLGTSVSTGWALRIANKDSSKLSSWQPKNHFIICHLAKFMKLHLCPITRSSNILALNLNLQWYTGAFYHSWVKYLQYTDKFDMQTFIPLVPHVYSVLQWVLYMQSPQHRRQCLAQPLQMCMFFLHSQIRQSPQYADA